MTDEDRLRETFEAHGLLTPDPAAVYARVQELARTHQRRRRGAQAAGGALLSAGLVAGVVNLPAILHLRPQSSAATTLAPAATTKPTSPTQPPSDQQKAWDAYFAAGYDYADALTLAKLWNLPTNDIGAVKATAGRRLLAGEKLPFPPTPDAPGPGSPAPDEQEAARVAVFFDAGYDYADAVKLAKLWHTTDPYQAKVLGGKKIAAGEKLPIKATPDGPIDHQQLQVDVFFAIGYDYADAVKLAKLWHLAQPYQAKVLGGKKLLAGEKLPIKPHPGTPPGQEPQGPTSAEQAQLAAYFAAGYNYDDAVTLAKLWHTTDPYQAKILGGKKLLAGETLPIKP